MADLARALVAAPWWEWREGMRLWRERPFSRGSEAGRVVLRDGRLSVAWESGSLWEPAADDWPTYRPDLSDAATAGILLDQIDAPIVTTHRRRSPSAHRVQWQDEEGRTSSTPWMDTLGEAAARALLEVRGG